MKRSQTELGAARLRARRGKPNSPYHKHGKKEFPYAEMYKRNPHLAAFRRAAGGGRVF